VAAGPLRKYPGTKVALGAGSLFALVLLTGLIGERGWRGSDPGPGAYAPTTEVITSGGEAVIIRRIHVIRRGTGDEGAPPVLPPGAAPSRSDRAMEQPVTRTRGS
jgi:hypothetical protein